MTNSIKTETAHNDDITRLPLTDKLNKDLKCHRRRRDFTWMTNLITTYVTQWWLDDQWLDSEWLDNAWWRDWLDLTGELIWLNRGLDLTGDLTWLGTWMGSWLGTWLECGLDWGHDWTRQMTNGCLFLHLVYGTLQIVYPPTILNPPHRLCV